MKPIRSADNPRYKALRRLVESSHERKRAGLSVLEGARLIEAFLDRCGAPEEVFVSRRGLRAPAVRALLERLPAQPPLVLSDALYAAVSTVATPSGVLALVKTPRPRPVPQDMDACVMLQGLQDPGNLGTILRTCAAAGIRHVLLSRDSVHAWSPRVLRAAMGAHFALSIYEQVDLALAAAAFGGRTIATDPRARRLLYEADLAGRIAFLFGSEGRGLPEALKAAAHETVAIPMPGGTESLNAAAAVAVCLFERVRQQRVRSGGPRGAGAQ